MKLPLTPAPRLRRAIAALCAGLSLSFAHAPLAKTPAPSYKIKPFAQLPAIPGFYEGVAIHGNTVFVSGPARFGTAGTGPSAIQRYSRKTGQLLESITVTGENLDQEHALSNIATDCQGRVYALSTQLGLLQFAKHKGAYVQHSYGDPLPNLPVCGPGVSGACEPTRSDSPPLANDLAFDSQGRAYVTDSLQATIFRYPAGGGAPEVWFQSASLEGGGPIPFGPNGIRIAPAGLHILFATTTSFADPSLGTIYSLPLKDGNTDADLKVVHQYSKGEGPDQLVFGSKGDLYVTLALANQISIVKVVGDEVRVASKAEDPIPLDNPAALAFDTNKKSLLIVNHALLSGNSEHFALLSADTRDAGWPLIKPCGE
jgi:sugar lactone lactonase YvrE